MLTVDSTTSQLADRLRAEIYDLASEIYAETHDWQRAITGALADLPDMIAHADDWNDYACAAGNLLACPF